MLEPALPEVEILEEPTPEGSAMFEEISRKLFALEKFLRHREKYSKVSSPLYNMRWGISQLRKFYESGQTVNDKHTRYEEYLENNP